MFHICLDVNNNIITRNKKKRKENQGKKSILSCRFVYTSNNINYEKQEIKTKLEMRK